MTTAPTPSPVSLANVEDVERLARRIAEDLAERDGQLFLVTTADSTAETRLLLSETLGPVFGAFQALELEYEEVGELGYEGWGGPRVTVDKTLSPACAWWNDDDDDPSFVAGGWVGENLFAVTRVRPYADGIGGGLAGVSVGHYHPGSMCSGYWEDTLAVASQDLAFYLKRNDEDGYYLELRRVDAASAGAIARTVAEFVRSVELFGAEDRLLTAYLLGFSESLPASVLEGENEGYEISTCTIWSSEEVLDELRKQNPTPTAKEARAWLDAIGYGADYEEGADHYLDAVADSPLVEELRALADEDAIEAEEDVK